MSAGCSPFPGRGGFVLHFPLTLTVLFAPSKELFAVITALVSLLCSVSNGFLGLSLNDRTILFLVILLDKTVSVG